MDTLSYPLVILSPSDCFVTDHFVSEKSSFYAMEADLLNSRAITACSDRKIRIYDLVSGKETKAVKGMRKITSLNKRPHNFFLIE